MEHVNDVTAIEHYNVDVFKKIVAIIIYFKKIRTLSSMDGLIKI